MTMPMEEEQVANLRYGAAIGISPEEEEILGSQLFSELQRARSERAQLVSRANQAERKYNLDSDDGPVFKDTPMIQVPASVARVDRVSSELSGAFDRDGSPIYTAIPLTNSMTEHAQHKTKMLHSLLQKADMIRAMRTTIKRAAKVGTGVFVSEIMAREIVQTDEAPVSLEGMMVANDAPQGEGQEYENVLVVRSVKIQDMYVVPMNVSDITEASFVGERFSIPKWMFDDALEDGFYSLPVQEDGTTVEIRPGYYDADNGSAEEERRVGYSASPRNDNSPSDFYDLIRGWVRYRPTGARKHGIYYVVFPVANPNHLLHVSPSPYESLDRCPYTFWNIDEGDGSIFGRGYMELLQDMQYELNALNSLRLETLRRSYSKVWMARKGSPLADEIEKRSNQIDPDADPADLIEMSQGGGSATIHPDEVFITDNPQQDLIGISLAEFNPNSRSEEQLLQGYMDMATVDNNPLQGIRTAFEVRQAASETSAKLKQYLKVLASTGLRPAIEIIRAQVWDYIMPISGIDDNIRFIEYGDFSYPINKTDYFSGMTIEPSGTTTSADEMVAISNTASLISEFVPMFIQLPGLVPDPVKSVREVFKARARALGMENFETVFGLTEPTPEQVQKAMMYRQIVMGASNPGQPMAPGIQSPMGMEAMMPGGGAPLGGDGGAVQGPPDLASGGAMAGPQEAAQQNGGNVE